VGDFGHPLVPVLVHEVVDYTAGGIGQVFIEVLGLAHELDGGDDHDFLFVRREKEAFHAFFKFGHLFAGAAVGVHDEELGNTFYCVGEGDLSAFVDPDEIAFRAGCAGDALQVGTVGVHDVEVGIAAVLLYAFI
jgi:hypothetical protein